MSAQRARAGHLALSAPAKLNLGLRIVGRRQSGHHELSSVFVPLDLADEVEVTCAGDAPEPAVSFELAGCTEGVPAGRENLAARAAEGFLAAAGVRAAVRVRLLKWLPAASGMGGGSSDAGAVLRALSRLLPEALSPARLAELALELGADVPFFLDPRPALVTGIGEHIEPLASAPSLALVVASPGKPLSTARVFAAFAASGAALTPQGSGPTIRALSELRGRDGRLARDVAPDLLPSLLENDLEPAATSLCPAIATLRERLAACGAVAVGMSGSGPTLFGIFEAEQSARDALERAAFPPPIWARVARSAAAGEPAPPGRAV